MLALLWRSLYNFVQSRSRIRQLIVHAQLLIDYTNTSKCLKQSRISQIKVPQPFAVHVHTTFL